MSRLAPMTETTEKNQTANQAASGQPASGQTASKRAPLAPAPVGQPQQDPLEGSDVVRDACGDAFGKLEMFHGKLVAEGGKRGLIGPREVPRLWERHILNSAALVPFVEDFAARAVPESEQCRVADIGSGAGFPGIVLAAMLPQAKFTLIEPMERRVDWLEEVVGELGLENVEVVRDRAEDYPHKGSFDIVVCRAVARLAKLVPWVMPLVRPGGRVIALKGQSAQQEIDKAAKEIRKARGLDPAVHGAPVGQGLEPTFVVTIDKRARR